MERKDYALITLSTILLISIGFNVMPEPTHYCDVTQTQAHCFDVSSTLKTCYTIPNKAGGKICSSLWQKIPDNVEQSTQCPPYVIAYTDNGKWFCDKVGIDAKCVQDNTLNLPIN